MKSSISILALWVIIVSSCSPQKKLEVTAPFTLGEVYSEKWIVEDKPENGGYEVTISILSLDSKEAVLQNLYHKGQIANLTIELREIGTVALAEYAEIEPVEQDTVPVDLKNETELFPFQLTDTEAVLSYLHNEKVKYFKLNGIRQNPVKVYPSLEARNSD
ncbi:hypothetical protein MNBD_BACTEROID03-1536 [hydrothermal vent metagenome]|uniref:Lipoprotein n=1 Tax=hydrothermal vent metagenome TaxID=652676 RepID=A0A3B0TFB7_9ZZZZ